VVHPPARFDEAALPRSVPDTAFEPRVEELETTFVACCANMTAMGKTAERARSYCCRKQGDGRPAIVVRDLVRRFGDFAAVAGTSFSVARGNLRPARTQRRGQDDDIPHVVRPASRPAAISKSPG
jgi:hypothetical protein